MALTLRGFIDLPPHAQGGLDHGDVHLQSGRVFVAHTASGTVEVIDGQERRHLATINECPEVSGVLCAQDEGLVFAAARGAGKVLVIEALSGPSPGSSWSGRVPLDSRGILAVNACLWPMSRT